MIGGRVERRRHPPRRDRRRPRAPPGRDRPHRDRRLPHRQARAHHRCRRLDRLRAGAPGAQVRPGDHWSCSTATSRRSTRSSSSIYGHGLLDTRHRARRHPRRRGACDEVFDEHRPEIVFHAAALKHLPMLERFPDEGWKTNVLGTLNVLRLAASHRRRALRQHLHRQGRRRHERAGHTKRIAEQLTAWYAEQTGPALHQRPVRQRPGLARLDAAHVQRPDRRRRPDHGHPPRRHPLLHDDPRGLRARGPGRRHRPLRRGDGPRDGRAGEDPRRRPPDDRAVRRARASRSSSPACARARSCTSGCSPRRSTRSAPSTR